jgi:hypothetical protein
MIDLHLVPRLRMSGAVLHLSPYAFMVWTGAVSTFFFNSSINNFVMVRASGNINVALLAYDHCPSLYTLDSPSI